MLSSNYFLFINIDGVLTSARTYWTPIESMQDTLDPVALKLLEKFCKDLPVKLVIASNWATFFKDLGQWELLFKNKGVELPLHAVLPVDVDIPLTWAARARDYMEAHPNTPFALLIDEPPQENSFVVTTNRQIGLTTSDLLKVAQKLNPTSPVITDLQSLHKGFPREASW